MSGRIAIALVCDSSTYASSACFDLRRHVRGIARVPDILARLHDCRGQFAQQDGDVRSLVERILAADRFDRAAAAVADRHADPVAADQPPAFVGDRVRGVPNIELLVRGARKCFQLLPQALLFGEVAEPAGLQEVAGKFAHLQQESQVAALRGDPRAGPLKYFDHALRTLIVLAPAPARAETRSDSRPHFRRCPLRRRFPSEARSACLRADCMHLLATAARAAAGRSDCRSVPSVAD